MGDYEVNRAQIKQICSKIAKRNNEEYRHPHKKAPAIARAVYFQT